MMGGRTNFENNYTGYIYKNENRYQISLDN